MRELVGWIEAEVPSLDTQQPPPKPRQIKVQGSAPNAGSWNFEVEEDKIEECVADYIEKAKKAKGLKMKAHYFAVARDVARQGDRGDLLPSVDEARNQEM